MSWTQGSSDVGVRRWEPRRIFSSKNILFFLTIVIVRALRTSNITARESSKFCCLVLKLFAKGSRARHSCQRDSLRRIEGRRLVNGLGRRDCGLTVMRRTQRGQLVCQCTCCCSCY
ncbi:hypothetical protein BDZ97DRAFT_1825736 [Flammula alnicola]|nr:hypothetical protein BDZ97DRAFT_1825736 [Flammula alnicola]